MREETGLAVVPAGLLEVLDRAGAKAADG